MRALFGQAALDRLADPEGGVGGELVALAPVELLGRPDQAEDALLDQVEKRQLLPLVLLGDRHDEAQVRVDHALLGAEVALLDPLREVDLLVSREQGVAPDLVQEQLESVGCGGGELAVAESRRLDARAPAVVADIDAVRLEIGLERVDVVVHQLQRLHELVELGQVHAAALLTAGKQCGHLWT